MAEQLPTTDQIMNDPFLFRWNAGALFTVGVPLIIMTFSRMTNNGDGGNNGGGDGQQGWWWGNGNNGNNGGEGGENRGPWWWFWDRDDAPENEGKGALVFVYIWSVLVFIALTTYGNHVMKNNRGYEGLLGGVFMFTNLAFVSMLLVSGFAINVEGGNRDLEEHGWYGQFSVCVFLTCLFWVIHGLLYTYILRRRNLDAMRAAAIARQNNSYASSSIIDRILYPEKQPPVADV